MSGKSGSKCGFIIAHQDGLEAELAVHFEQTRPDVVGNAYEVLGTVQWHTWRTGMERPNMLEHVLAHTADIKEYQEIDDTPGGHYQTHEKPVRATCQRSRR